MNSNHRANQLNPNNAAFKAAQDNRANQLNPNSAVYQSSRNPTGSGYKFGEQPQWTVVQVRGAATMDSDAMREQVPAELVRECNPARPPNEHCVHAHETKDSGSGSTSTCCVDCT